MEDLSTHEMIILKQILKRCDEVCVCVCVCVDYINLAQDGKKLQVLVNNVMNL